MLYVVRIRSTAAAAPLIEAGLESDEREAASWQHADTGESQFEVYHTAHAEADRDAAALRQRATTWCPAGGYTVDVADLADADWQDAWKAFFRAERVSAGVMVYPPWEAPDPAVRAAVEINPGLSFGTGRHFTTRSCLQLLDRLSREFPGVSLVDVGCGSGILAIAAAKLGYSRVTAFDNDPQAILSTRENVAANGVKGRVAVCESGVEDFDAGAGFDVVVANLYDDVLRRFAPRLAGFLVDQGAGRIVLSGMLRGQVAGVVEVFAGIGFVSLERLEDHEWVAVLLGRQTMTGLTGES